jgi:hypothetical protein
MCSATEYRKLNDTKVINTRGMKYGVDGGLGGAHKVKCVLCTCCT